MSPPARPRGSGEADRWGPRVIVLLLWAVQVGLVYIPATLLGLAFSLVEDFRPRYLVIDELDKMKAEDFSVLLSLMQSGVVARLKKGMREVEHMVTWVFAGCNRRDRLPPELLSRFVEFQFTPYTREEFVEVAVAVITRPLGKDPGLARYIAERVSQRTRDVLQVRDGRGTRGLSTMP